jgi:hypothetical protein
MSKLNTALRGLGLPEMDIEPVISGLRAGTITPNYVVGAVEEGLKIAGGAVEVAAKVTS